MTNFEELGLKNSNIINLVDQTFAIGMGNAIIIISSSIDLRKTVLLNSPIMLVGLVIYEYQLDILINEKLTGGEPYEANNLTKIIVRIAIKTLTVIACKIVWQELELSLFYEGQDTKKKSKDFEQVLNTQKDLMIIIQKE